MKYMIDNDSICLSICPYENGYPWNNPTGIDPISAMIAVNHHITLPIWGEELIPCWDQKPGSPTSKELADVHPKFTHFYSLLVHVGRAYLSHTLRSCSAFQHPKEDFNFQRTNFDALPPAACGLNLELGGTGECHLYRSPRHPRRPMRHIQGFQLRFWPSPSSPCLATTAATAVAAAAALAPVLQRIAVTEAALHILNSRVPRHV